MPMDWWALVCTGTGACLVGQVKRGRCILLPFGARCAYGEAEFRFKGGRTLCLGVQETLGANPTRF